MSTYCFFDVREITDQAKVEQYLAGVFATVEQYGGRYLVLGGKSDLVEGDWQPVYPVIVEFADGEHAQRWYSSPEYEPLKALRVAGTRSSAVFLEGATPGSEEAAVQTHGARHRKRRLKSTTRCSFQRCSDNGGLSSPPRRE